MKNIKLKTLILILILGLGISSLLYSSPGKSGHGDFEIKSTKFHFTKLKIDFSEDFDPATITTSNLYLQGEEGNIPYSIKHKKHGKKLEIRIGHKLLHLLRPFVLVLKPEIKSKSGKLLSKGYIKVFNVYIADGPIWGNRTILVSESPRIEIDPTVFSRLPYRKWLKRIGPGKCSRDEKKYWDELKHIARREKMKHHHFYFLSLFFPCHFPYLTVSGISSDGMVNPDAGITVQAGDQDNDITFFKSFINFSPYVSNTPITDGGESFIFSIVSDFWHKGDYKFSKFSIDNEAPQFLSIIPSSDKTVMDSLLTVSGEVLDAAILTINGINTPLIPGTDNKFTFSKELTLIPGENQIEVKAKDSSGNETIKSFKITYIADTSAPVIQISSPAESSFLKNTEVVITGTVTDSDTAGNNSTVKYISGNGVLGTITRDDFLITITLTEGENSVLLKAEDLFGNVAQTSVNFIIDTTSPIVQISSPDAGVLLNNAAVSISGKVTDLYSDKIELINGAQPPVSGSLIAGNFIFENIDLIEGENIFTIKSTDRSGNIGDNKINVFYDSVAPQLIITSPQSGILLGTKTVLINGTVSDPGSSLANIESVTINGIIVPITGESFSYITSLSEGINNIEIKALDMAGNFSTSNIIVNVDTIAPELTVSAPRNNMFVNTNTINVSGIVSANTASVKVNGNDAVISGNSFSLNSVSLSDGVNTLLVKAVDMAGNETLKTVTLTLDTLKPEIVSVAPASGTDDVPVDFPITIEFSEEIDVNTANTVNIKLESSHPQNGISRVAGNITVNGKYLIFTPELPLLDSAVFTLSVSNAITDKSGNQLTQSFTGSFSTPDMTAPDKPIVNETIEQTSKPVLTVSGTAEAGSVIEIEGGSQTITTSANENGIYSAEILLNTDTLNSICITAKDSSNNISLPACISIYHDSTEFNVIESAYVDNTVKITFSKPVLKGSITSDNIKITTSNGLESGIFNYEDGDRVVIFTPEKDLSAGSVLLEVDTGIKDLELNGLSASFKKLLNSTDANTIVFAKVFDDSTGLPLSGVIVKVISLDGAAVTNPAEQAQTTTTSEGDYILPLSGASGVLNISREGFTISQRVFTSIAGSTSKIFDSRLSHVSDSVSQMDIAGGVLVLDNGSLVYPDSAFSGDGKVKNTELSAQSLTARLPMGYSPVYSIEFIKENDTALIKPIIIKVLNNLNIIDSASLILAYWDETVYKWRAVAPVSVSSTELSAEFSKLGVYSILIKDTVPTPPPAIVLGEVLFGVSPISIPDGTIGDLTFNPEEILPGDQTKGTITLPVQLPSGTPVQAKFFGTYTLLSDEQLKKPMQTADLTLYRNGTSGIDGTIRGDYKLSPSKDIKISDIKIGTIHTDIVRYSSGILGVVIDKNGGIVTGDGGSEVVIPANAVQNPIAVTIKKIITADLPLNPPSGFELLGAVDLSLGGARLYIPAELSLSLSNPVDAGDSVIVAAKLCKIEGSLKWYLSSLCIIEDNKVKTIVSGDLPFKGVNEGGSYIFIKTENPAGFIKGIVSFTDTALSGADLSVSGHDVKSLSLSNGSYVEIADVSSFNIEAKDRYTGYKRILSTTIPGPGEIISLDLNIEKTGPVILGITPENEESGVPEGSIISFIFSEKIKGSTFNQTTVYIKSGVDTISGTFTLADDGKQGVFTPDGNLPSGKKIDITITTGLMDINGTPMGSVFYSSFFTKDSTPPEVDNSKIKIVIPENGVSKVWGAAGSAEVGSTVTVYNINTGATSNATVLSDGSFEMSINAEKEHKLSVKIIDAAGNITELPAQPLYSEDGKSILADGKNAIEFTTPEGIGFKSEAGSFNGPVTIRLEKITDFSTLAEMPEGYSRLGSLNLNFSADIANKPLKLSIPAPAGITDATKMFIAKEEYIFGKRTLMILDTVKLKDGRLEVNSPPWPEVKEKGDFSVIAAAQSHSVGYYNIHTLVPNGHIIFVGAYALKSVYYGKLIIPAKAGEKSTITVRDAITGEIIYEQLVEGPESEDQIKDITIAKNDKTEPAINKIDGLNILSFSVSSREIISGKVKVTPSLTDNKVTSISIKGDIGTTIKVEDGSDDKNGEILLYKFDKDNKKYIYETDITANTDGSFEFTQAAKADDKFILGIETGGISLDHKFTLAFDESINVYKDGEDLDSAIKIEEYDKPDPLKIFGYTLPSGTELLVYPQTQFKENMRYKIKLHGFKDYSGNSISDDIKFTFRTKKSKILSKIVNMGWVRDTILYNGYLFVAYESGFNVFDVSNPSEIKKDPVFSEILPGMTWGIAIDRKTKTLVVVYSGYYGVITKYDISNPKKPTSDTMKDTLILTASSQGQNYPLGIPYDVAIDGRYAYIAGGLAGLIIVDLGTAEEPIDKLKQISRTDDHASEVKLLVKISKDENGDETKRILVVTEVMYHGLKIFDINPANPQNIVTLGDFEFANTVGDIAISKGFHLDINENGKVDADEIKDLVFYTVDNKIYVIDVTKPDYISSSSIIRVFDIKVKDKTVSTLGSMVVDKETKTLYINTNLGLMLFDIKSFSEEIEDKNRVLATIKTTGTSRFGLVIDKELGLAYTGQQDKGVDIIRLSPPMLKMFYLENGIYKEVNKISPNGLHSSYNEFNYPSEIYIRAYLPGGIVGELDDSETKGVFADIQSMNLSKAPMVPWGTKDTDARTSFKKLKLKRMTDVKGSDNYNIFQSEAIQVTINPKSTFANKRLLAGNVIEARLNKKTNEVTGTYLLADNCKDVKVEILSTRTDVIDNINKIAEAPDTRKPNSSANNPSLYAGANLFTGEYSTASVDLSIPGRGFDFVFARTYRSQAVYSGVIGWGWDHNYNRRLLEMDNGDILYYDGTGRVERYKAKNTEGVINGYEPPDGWFTELTQRSDGTFYHIFSDRTIEVFDLEGKLIRLMDSNNNKMEFYYDLDGQLSSVVDTMGRIISFEYYTFEETETAKDGRLKTITDFAGRKVNYEYNTEGDLTEVDFEGRTTKYTYQNNDDINLAHNLKTIIDSENRSVVGINYTADKVSAINFPGSSVTINSGASASVTDGRGNVKSYTFNDKGNALSVVDGGFTTAFEYNEDGLVTKITLPEDNYTKYTYETYNKNSDFRRSQGNVLNIEENPGSLSGEIQNTVYTYNNYTNKVDSVKNPKDISTTFVIDPMTGNVKSANSPDSTSVSYTYDKYGRVNTINNQDNKVTKYDYYSENVPFGNGSASTGGRTLDVSAGGFLKSITVDFGGQNIKQEFVYDNYGNLKSTKDGMGVINTFEYNKFGELMGTVQGTSASSNGQPAVNLATAYTRYMDGRVDTVVKNGITLKYTYDLINRTVNINKSAGALSQAFIYRYNENGKLAEIVYPKGNKDNFNYNTRDLLFTESKSGTIVKTYEYNNNGNLEFITDGRNKKSKIEYDGHNRTKKVLDPLNNFTEFIYDKNSNLLNQNSTGTDGKKLEYEFEYNNVDQLRYKRLKAGTKTISSELNYTPAGQVNKIINPNGNAVDLTYHGSGLPLKVTGPLGNKTESYFDSRGLFKSSTETEAGGRTSSNSVVTNVLGNIAKTKDNIDRNSDMYFTPKHQLSAVEDPEKGVVGYLYDDFGRLFEEVRMVDYEGSKTSVVTKYEYDANGNLKYITNAKKGKTQYHYDDRDRLFKVTYPDNNFETITYNNDDSVQAYTDMNGTVITNTYDDGGRLTRKDITRSVEAGILGTTFETFEYDGLNRIKKTENDDSIIDYIYNAEGRVEKEIQSIKEPLADSFQIVGTYEVSMSYDDVGNLTSLTYPSGKVITINPDALNRIDNVTSSGVNIAKYTYEGLGKITKKILGNNAVTMDTHFDDGKRPDSLTYKKGSDLIFSKGMSWNKVDMKLTESGLDFNKEYKYDSAKRLREEVKKKNNQITDGSLIEIDGDESLKTVRTLINGTVKTGLSTQTNNRNQFTSVDYMTNTDITPIHIDPSYDKNGNLTKFGHQYIYNYKNQLVQIITGTGINTAYKYDVIGRRLEKIVEDPNGADTTRYVHNGWRVIEERDENNLIKARYTYGNNIDERVQLELKTGAGTDLTSFIPMYDTIGNTIGISDSSGKLFERYFYNTYGIPLFYYDESAPKNNNMIILDSNNIEIRMNEPIKRDTVQNNLIITNGGTPISGSFSYSEDDRVVTFTSSSPIPQGVTLTAEISTGLEDMAGNKLANTVSQSFIYTGSSTIISDTMSPEVEDIKMSSNEFIIGFNERIDQNDLTGSVELINDTSTVSGAVTLEDGRTIKFVPAGTIPNDSKWSITINNKIKDLSGKTLSPFVHDFIVRSDDFYVYQKTDINVHDRSRVGNTHLFHGRDFEPEIGLYFYRHRYYMPRLGRFLQQDPLGYKDSMNLYQGMNMNPYNYLDPFGEARINIFIGYEENLENSVSFPEYSNAYKLFPRSKVKRENPTVEQFRFKYPDWNGLQAVAGDRHTVNIRRLDDWNSYGEAEFYDSLRDGSDTWTFFIGHSAGRRGINFGTFYNSTDYLPRTENKYVGIFACDSELYASNLFTKTNNLFSTRSKIRNSNKDRGQTKLQNLSWAAYALISQLVLENKEDDIQGALKKARGRQGIQYIDIPRDRKDTIIHEDPQKIITKNISIFLSTFKIF